MTQPYLFALCTETKLVRARDLLHLAVPLERNAQHVASAWGVPAPAVVVADSAKLPDGCRPIVFVDGEGDPGTLGQHYWDDKRLGPAARVFVDHTSGLRDGPFSACESAAHEIGEATINPMLDRWLPWPQPRSDERVQVAVEINDPCQDTYTIAHAGARWPVANFVMPAWFYPKLFDDAARLPFLRGGDRFDWLGLMQHPGDLSPEGYVVLRSRDTDSGPWRYWDEWASMKVARAALQHPWSRTKQLLASAQ